jgi:ribulose-phosphate 3-epimerase
MLRISASLWSADLANLAADIRRIDPFVDSYHLDVADGHYVPSMLFFPDLVRALRPHTRKPFEVHLMTCEPGAWLEPFAEAGADSLIFCHDSAKDPAGLVHTIHHLGKHAGVSLALNEPLSSLESMLPGLHLVTLMGTEVGIKGVGMDPRQPERVRSLRTLILQRGLEVEIQADGGIRGNTVPLLAAAGADSIVPGSLLFGSDPAELRCWLATLPGPTPAGL